MNRSATHSLRIGAPLSRRTLLRRGGGALLGWAATGSILSDNLASGTVLRRRIGACDWSLGKTADPAAFALARTIGLDGVQVSLGTHEHPTALSVPETQQRYREAARANGIAIASLAMGELNRVPFKSDPRTLDWVRIAVSVCGALGCRTILLAFFGQGDLRGDPDGVTEVVRRLREVAPAAERAGVTLGIESWLNAEAHVDLIQRVGSPAVKVYYDVANATQRGYDVPHEIRWLGRQGLICEFHAKENGFLLGQGKVDFPAVRAAMDDIGYQGWIQIEGALPRGRPLQESYRANLHFLRHLFAAA